MSKTPAIARAAATTPNRVEFGAPSAGAAAEGHSVKQQSVGSHSHLFRVHSREPAPAQPVQHLLSGVAAQQAAWSGPEQIHTAGGRQATAQVVGSLTAQKVQPTMLVLNVEE
jgi:hypothetical protein